MGKKYYIIFFCCFLGLGVLPFRSFSQGKEHASIRGTIVDKRNGDPLPFASVSLLGAPDSSFLQGKQTNKNGKFVFSIKKKDSFLLKITFMGYQTRYFSVISSKRKRKLGKIELSPFSNKLKAVTVKAEKKPMYEYNKDSVIFNVPEGFQTGGTAQDVLEFAPSLMIDENGKITVKGKGNIGVYVDSRPISELGINVNEFLQNTPAFMIETVKILKKPPDPEDAAKALAAGITDRYYLNIITRKIRYRGYNAAITAGMDTHNQQTVRMRLNMNMKPFQLDYNNNLQGRTDSSYLYRTSYLKNDDSSVLNQKNYTKNTGFNQNLRARYNLQFSKKENLRLQTRIGWNLSDSKSNNISNILNPVKIPNQNRIQDNQNHANGLRISTNADYKKKYEKEGKELDASFNFRMGSRHRLRNANGAYLLKGDTLLQHDKGNNQNKGIHSHIMYKNAFGSENKHFYMVNGSFSTDIRHNLNDVSRSDTTLSSRKLFDDKRLSSNYFSHDNDFSTFLLVGKRDEKLGWLTGASLSYKVNNNHDDYRGSSVNSHVFSARTGFGMNFGFPNEQKLTLRLTPRFQYYEQNTIPNDSIGLIAYKYTNLIPGASAKFERGEQEISFHYDRKLGMPNWRQLNPYIDNSDPLNIHTGNPDLRPTFTNEYKLRYEYNHKFFYTSLDLEDQLSKDVISPYTTVDSNGVSTTTFVNLHQQKRQSAQLNAGIHYFKDLADWNARLNINAGGGLSAYSMTSDDEHVSKDFHDVSGLTGNFKMWTSFKYKFLSLSIYGRYYGPRYFSQGKTPSRFRSGVRTRATFLDHSLSFSFSLRNIFGASVRDNFYKTDRYIQYSNNRQNVRYFSFYITYQFKNYKKLGKEAEDG